MSKIKYDTQKYINTILFENFIGEGSFFINIKYVNLIHKGGENYNPDLKFDTYKSFNFLIENFNFSYNSTFDRVEFLTEQNKEYLNKVFDYINFKPIISNRLEKSLFTYGSNQKCYVFSNVVNYTLLNKEFIDMFYKIDKEIEFYQDINNELSFVYAFKNNKLIGGLLPCSKDRVFNELLKTFFNNELKAKLLKVLKNYESEG